MLAQIGVIITHFLLIASCYNCVYPTPPPAAPDLLDPEFGSDLIDTVGECYKGLTSKLDAVKLLSNLLPGLGMVTGHNCIAKGLTKIGSTNVVKNIAKLVSFIPQIGGDIAGAMDFFNSDDTLETIKQEFRNQNETILCALDIQSEKLLNELNASEERLTEHINGKMKELKNEIENVRRDVSVRIVEVNSRLNIVLSKIEEIITKLNQIYNGVLIVQKQIENLKFFNEVKSPLSKLKEAYIYSVNYSGNFENRFQENCMLYKPMEIVISIRDMLASDDINLILGSEGYSDEIYKDLLLCYYDSIIEAGDMLYNCDMGLTYDEKRIEFTNHANEISQLFLHLYDSRKEKFWNSTVLQPAIDDIITTNPNNSEAAKLIYDMLNTRYDTMGYNFLVAVYFKYSNKDRQPSSDVITFDYINNATENRFVYIVRNVKASSYQKCPSLELINIAPQKMKFLFTMHKTTLTYEEMCIFVNEKCPNAIKFLKVGPEFLLFDNIVYNPFDFQYVAGDGFLLFKPLSRVLEEAPNKYFLFYTHALMQPMTS